MWSSRPLYTTKQLAHPAKFATNYKYKPVDERERLTRTSQPSSVLKFTYILCVMFKDSHFAWLVLEQLDALQCVVLSQLVSYIWSKLVTVINRLHFSIFNNLLDIFETVILFTFGC